MKKFLLSFLMLIAAVPLWAHDLEVNGIYYNIDQTNKTISVSAVANEYSGAVMIPPLIIYNDVEYTVTSIDTDAFRDCTGLTSISIPNSVTSIGGFAFSGCSGLTGTLTIPNSVTSIGDYAFSECSGLTGALSIPNSVTSIGSSAFSGCSGLTKVTIPNSVTSISNKAFEACGGMTSVIIPNSVTSIGESAFYGCTSLTEIAIPNSVTEIGSSAFYGCTSLTEITISNSVTEIGSSAFYGCSGLTDVTIPNSVSYIDHEVFCYCTGLTSVAIGNSVRFIGQNAFDGCSSLTSINIPNSVTAIGDYAFNHCRSLTSITIPNSVTIINNYTFNGCTSLIELIIEDGMENLSLGYADSQSFNDGLGLFGYCPLETIYLGRNVSYPTGKTNGYSPFYKTPSLKSVTIGDSVTSINEYLFAECSGLTGTLIIPNSVTSIGDDAFCGCSGLTGALTIPNSVTSIGNSAFSRCTGLTGALTIPNSVTSIGRNAFFQCVGLTGALTIPNSVTSIGASAFEYCRSFTSVSIPNSISSIEDKTFSQCDGLTGTLIIPNSVTSIGDDAFRCPKLKKLQIESGSETLSFGDGYNSLNGLFGTCQLDSIYLGRNIQFSSKSPFYRGNFYTVPSVTIGNAVTSIRSATFSSCEVQEIKSEAIIAPSVSSNPFHTYNSVLFVPANGAITYVNDACWSKFHIVVENDSMYYTMTPDTTLVVTYRDTQYNSYKGDIVICDSVEIDSVKYKVSGIGESAFKNCVDLTSITIVEGVDSIGANAFDSCSKLSGTLNLPSTISKIGENAFNATYYSICKIAAKTPPTITSTSLGKIETAFVPVGSRTAYNNDAVWGELNIIEENPDYEVTVNVTTPGKLATDLVNQHMITPKSVTKLKVVGEINDNDIATMRTNMTSCSSIDLSEAVYYKELNDSVKISIIPDMAFEGKNYLTKIILPENCVSIGNKAFINCSALDSVIIHDKVEEIGDYTFQNCFGMAYVYIGAKVNRIGKYTFAECKGLSNVEFSDSISCDLIDNFAFSGCCNLSSIKLPLSVATIGNYAFYKCSSLTSITIPNSVNSIGSSAFNNCSSLTSATIGESVTSIGESAFYDCTSLTEITIPNSVTTIGDYAFNLCSALTSATIGDGVKSIPQSLFGNCSSLRELTIGKSVNSIASTFWETTPGLTKLVWNATNYSLFDICLSKSKSYETLKTIVFGNSVETISGLYSSLPALEDVYIGSGVNNITNCDFSRRNLQAVHITNLNAWQNINFASAINNPLCKTPNLYLNGELVTSVDIVLSNVKDYTFYGAKNITNVTFNNSVELIGNGSFAGSGITVADLSGCEKLTTIGNNAFQNCESLTTVNFPDTLANIGSYAFDHCKSLLNISSPSLVPPTAGTDAFEGVDNYNCLLAIPSEQTMDYLLAEHWGAFIEMRKHIDVTVENDSIVGDDDENIEGGEGNEGDNSGIGNHKQHIHWGFVWFDYLWHKLHDYLPWARTLNKNSFNDNTKMLLDEELPVEAREINGAIGDGQSLYVRTDSVVTFHIEPKEGYKVAKVMYGGVDVTDQLNNGIFVTNAVAQNTSLNVTFAVDNGEEEEEEEYVSGDANGDGEVSVSDIVMVANNIMGVASDSFVLDAADIDDDGAVSVTDIVMLSNIIMNSSATASIEPFAVNRASMSINNIENYEGDTKKIEIALDNEMDLTAFQIDVVLPNGMKMVDCSLSKRAMASHTLLSKEQNNGAYRLMSYSLGSHTYRGHEGAFLTLEVTTDGEFNGGDIMINNIRVAESNGSEHKLSAVKQSIGSISSVDAVNAEDLQITTKDHTIVIESSVETIAYIYSVDGMVREMPIYVGSNEMNVDVDGLYIVKVGSFVEKVMIK